MELMLGSDPKERNLEDRYYEQAAACARERNCMNEVNKTLYIPLYGKSKVSRQGIILNDPCAEEIWKEEAFPIHGKSRSKWLAYNMAMRARVFDDWTDILLQQNEDALVLHIGCGLDSRYMRIKSSRSEWIDCDLSDVIETRKKHFQENETYHMKALDASRPEQIESLPNRDTAIVVLEGLSMYLTNSQVHGLLQALDKKYQNLHILMDVYTEFGVKASNYKNPVRDVGVTRLYGIDDIESIICDLRIRFVKEHSFTPKALVNELAPLERLFFKMLFTGKLYRKIYRLYELES
jgi:O-methyltransferase involved in polyketide biosynthesis